MSLDQTFNQDASGDIGVSGLATTTSPSYTTATQNPLSLTLAGAVRTDSSAVTQPVSATTLPLPTGAATATLQTSGNASLTTIATETTAISGQLPATLGQKVSASSLAVVLASDETVPVTLPVSTTAAQTSVAGSAASVSLLASNSSRKGYSIFNDSTAILYVGFTATTTTSAYSVKLFPNSCISSEFIYTGVISGIWASAAGAAKVTEYT